MQRAPVQRLRGCCQPLYLLPQRCINTDIDYLLGHTLVRKFLVRNTSSALTGHRTPLRVVQDKSYRRKDVGRLQTIQSEAIEL